MSIHLCVYWHFAVESHDYIVLVDVEWNKINVGTSKQKIWKQMEKLWKFIAVILLLLLYNIIASAQWSRVVHSIHKKDAHHLEHDYGDLGFFILRNVYFGRRNNRGYAYGWIDMVALCRRRHGWDINIATSCVYCVSMVFVCVFVYTINDDNVGFQRSDQQIFLQYYLKCR